MSDLFPKPSTTILALSWALVALYAVSVETPAYAGSDASFSPAIALNSNADGDQGSDRRPALAGDTEGRWIAVWQSEENLDDALGKDWDILFAVSEDDGQAWSRPAPITLYAANDRGQDQSPAIATDGDGTWIVMWQGASTAGASLGPDADIIWSRSTDTGRSWSRPAAIDPGASGDTGLDLAPSLSVGDRTWVAVWESSEDRRGAGKDFDIFISRSADAGATWSRAAFLNTNAASDVDTDRSPVVTTDGQGRWLVVWESYDSLAGRIGRDWDLLYAFSADDGKTWTAPAPANARAEHDGSLSDLAPQLAATLGDDGMLLWTAESGEAAQGNQQWQLRSRSFDFKKGKWGREELVHASTSRPPALKGAGVVRAHHKWVASWVFGRRGEGGDSGIAFAARSGRGGWGEVPGPIPAVSCLERSDGDLVLASDSGKRSWLACWSSQRRGGGPHGSDRDLFCTHHDR